ncbi:hypothetical protein D3C81_2215840 [compost metagenome]
MAFVVHIRGIAGMQPAVAQGSGGFLRLVPVTPHKGRALDQDFADGTTLHFIALPVGDFQQMPPHRLAS